ncbi:MAG TPA: patatin-like phospholipase family protein [Solirubrobacterales bacterium]|nr:patatin-like phospholipase family protein [Solirubrobacterales bacterium]
MSPNGEGPKKDRFRILCVDGGGIRGLISALVIAEIERRLAAKRKEKTRMADCFHLFAGTSTGGLIALALTRPDPVPGDQLAGFYTEDGPEIFDYSLGRRLRTGWGTFGPKYDEGPLREAVLARLGNGKLAEATRDLLVTSYDMTARAPFFFKRWKAQQEATWNFPVVDAALSTAAAPTYFPCHEPELLKGHALVDGGVFAANPAIAAIAEGLGRNSDQPPRPTLDEMLVVSIGTGEFGTGFTPSQVRGWGGLGWIAGGGDEPPILSAMLGGSSDGTDYWAHMLLNHEPGEDRPTAETVGHGERYYRFQVELAGAIEMDDASPETLTKRLPEAAARLIDERSAEIDDLVTRLTPIE